MDRTEEALALDLPDFGLALGDMHEHLDAQLLCDARRLPQHLRRECVMRVWPEARDDQRIVAPAFNKCDIGLQPPLGFFALIVDHVTLSARVVPGRILERKLDAIVSNE